jgi:(5-formylfuran-3-yl)methyl phosphate synthase
MELLVSVRSVTEALAALEGGAALIDVKEPAHGSLGRPEERTIAAVIRAVAGRRPVSAAMGELLQDPGPCAADGLAFLKWGLAGYGDDPRWRRDLMRAIERIEARAAGCTTVTVAYADWKRAGAPPVEEVVAFAHRRPGGVLLLDTYGKGDGWMLLDWLSIRDIARVCRQCRYAGVRVALAGSLGPDEIRALLPVRPDWFAVRRAVCTGVERHNALSTAKVQALVELLAAAQGRHSRKLTARTSNKVTRRDNTSAK